MTQPKKFTKCETEPSAFYMKYLKRKTDDAFGPLNLSKKQKIDYTETILQLMRDK